MNPAASRPMRLCDPAAPPAPSRRIRGFTLIELAVILLLLVIILSMVGVNLTRDSSDLLREEGDRLALLIRAVQEEAIMQGRPFALAPAGDGYQFLRVDDGGKLKALGPGDVFAPYHLPQLIAIAGVRLEGVEEDKEPVIILDPAGALPIFTIVLKAGQIDWYVQGLANGRIHSAASPAPDAG